MAVTRIDRLANPTALVAAALAAAAGLLHLAVVRPHLAVTTLDGVLMLLAAWAQLAAAVALVARRPGRYVSAPRE
jgi:hypothetical protein